MWKATAVVKQKLVQMFHLVEDMDADTSVESGRFEDPHVLAAIMRLWHLVFR